MRHLDLRYGQKGVIIRNDNGSQFIAHQVRQTLQDLEAKQEFTHVAPLKKIHTLNLSTLYNSENSLIGFLSVVFMMLKHVLRIICVGTTT
jgi:hypothetical protein